MVDLHCHILPGIDDGARNMKESIAMCRMAVENNITKVVCTSHFLPGMKIDEFIAKRDKALRALRAEIAAAGIRLELVPGAEIYVSDEIFYVENIERLRLGKTNYVLVEFDFTGLTGARMMRYIDEVRKSGIQVIVAHPERYKYIQDDYNIINMLRKNGILLQVNAGSLLGIFGRREYKLAKELCISNAAFFLASDAHSTRVRNNALLEMFPGFVRTVSPEQIGRMLDQAPERLLSGQDMGVFDSQPVKKRLL